MANGLLIRIRNLACLCGFSVLLSVAGCQDLPTLDIPSTEPFTSDETYLLPPVVVDGGSHCSDPTWTRGEDGICRSPRGSGGSTGSDGGAGSEWGGGGGESEACFGCDESTPDVEGDDNEIIDEIPDCTEPQQQNWAKAFCRAFLHPGRISGVHELRWTGCCNAVSHALKSGSTDSTFWRSDYCSSLNRWRETLEAGATWTSARSSQSAG